MLNEETNPPQITLILDIKKPTVMDWRAMPTLKPIQPDNVLTLNSLARQANQYHDEALSRLTKARHEGREGIKAALLCGQALIQAKALIRHGDWLTWLGKHCPGIAEQTARKYMRLANRTHEFDLDEFTSLRQAMLALGIIFEPKVISEAPKEEEIISLEWFIRRLAWLKKEDLRKKVSEWPPEEKARLKEDLKPVVEFYEQL